MDEQKKPRAREKRVVEGSMSVEKHGEGLGTGPVGNTGGYQDRRKQEAAREKILQKKSIQEYRLAQLEMAKTANRLKVKSRNRI